MLSVITALEFFQHYFAKMGHRNTSCDPHLHQAIEQPMLPTSREAPAAGRLRPNAPKWNQGVSGPAALVEKGFQPTTCSVRTAGKVSQGRRPPCSTSVTGALNLHT